MASLEKIRGRAGLLIGFIGLALVAFVLQDLMSSGDRLFGGNSQILGEVNGEVIEQKDFEIELQQVSSLQNRNVDQSELRAGLWNDKINELVLTEEYNEDGIGLTADELTMVTVGLNNHDIDPFVKQLFGIQPGQEVTAQQLSASLNQLKENEPNRWNYLQNLIVKQRLNGKLNTLVANSYLATTAEAKAFYANSGRTASGSFVYKSYASVDEANKTVTDADIKAYYDAHKSEFKRPESRSVEYAIFDVQPSAEDNALVRKEIEALKSTTVEYNKEFKVFDTIPGFSTDNNISGFLREYSDKPYDPTFKAKGQLSATIDELMHSNEVGFVYGPYFETGSFKMARLIEKRNDSVQVAILVRDVVATDKTDKAIFKKASAFAMNVENTNFDEAVKTMDGGKSYKQTISQDDKQFPGLGKDNQLMRWAFKTTREVGEITRFTVDGNYVIARIKGKLPKGTASFDEIKEQLRPAAQNEKAKQFLINELNGVSTVEAAATKLGEQTKTFSSLSFASNTLEGAGYEPIAIGAIMGLKDGETSKPIPGSAGIVVAKVNSFTEPTESNDYKAIQSQIENAFTPRVNYELTPALRDNANIEDNRADFY